LSLKKDNVARASTIQQAVWEAATICPRPLWLWPWKWYPSHVWRELPLCQF